MGSANSSPESLPERASEICRPELKGQIWKSSEVGVLSLGWRGSVCLSSAQPSDPTLVSAEHVPRVLRGFCGSPPQLSPGTCACPSVCPSVLPAPASLALFGGTFSSLSPPPHPKPTSTGLRVGFKLPEPWRVQTSIAASWFSLSPHPAPCPLLCFSPCAPSVLLQELFSATWNT